MLGLSQFIFSKPLSKAVAAIEPFESVSFFYPHDSRLPGLERLLSG